MNVEEMYRRFLEELPAKTGRTIDEWRAEIRTNGPAKYGERIEWLKAEHGLGYRPACMLAQQAGETPGDYGDAAGLVDRMYAGAKTGLRPVYERLVEIAKGLGPDVTQVAGKTQVSLKRKHVFAQIRPATRTRVDLGFAFPKMQGHPRLVATGGLEKRDRISYRVGIGSIEEIDAEVMGWMRQAYERTAG